jgi:lactate 2-monooxygenase
VSQVVTASAVTPRQVPQWAAELTNGDLLGPERTSLLSLADLEKTVRQTLPAKACQYLEGGAGGEHTVLANLAAFSRWRIVPRVLRDMSERDLSVELLGMKLPAPVMLAPVGMQEVIHRDAEIATARAASSLGIPFILSTAASRCIEEVASNMGESPLWFQLYWSKDLELTASMLQRAEQAGCKAIVVTVDTPLLGWRERQRSYRNWTRPMVGMENYLSDPVFAKYLSGTRGDKTAAPIRQWQELFGNTALTWKDLPLMRRYTNLPVVLKGILDPDDADRAVDQGVDAIIVSNHGGRQLDGTVASLEMLPKILDRIGGRIPVLFDSGIRRGPDAFKALAMGASAVLLGRLYLWGLAVGGEKGVRSVLLNFLSDLDLTFILSGYRSCRELDRAAVEPSNT